MTQTTGGAPKPATAAIIAQQQRLAETLPFADRQDFEDAHRGFIAALEPCVVRDESGRVVWDNDSYAFLAGDAPDSVNPSLWRQSQLNAIQGLFEVVPGLYQVRGLDGSVMSFIEGERGVIVVDPLVSKETAVAAMALYRAHRGDRPVTGLVYTHCHPDHFGGARAVLDQADVDSGAVPVIAPSGFTEHAVSESVFAGTAMARRAGYMYGAVLDRGPRGQVGIGLAQTISTGAITFIPPTVDVTETGQELTVDGVRFVFQLAPDSEAPAEFQFLLPDFRALCMAENATHTLHNILTLRGAVVRDAHAWSKYLTEAIDLFGDQTDVVFASHNWPTWGHDRAMKFLAEQRDLYGYLHDQTLRMLNQGMTGIEIAEVFQMPPALENAWHARGYYGSVSHNVKAIYQRYMGWYDGNPVNLWKHPPTEAGSRYLRYMGGADAVVAKAREDYAAGDFRWAAEVLSHVVFADPDHTEARELLADTLEQLGYGAENGTWRSSYLSGAHELRHGSFGTPTVTASPDMFAQLSAEQWFDAFAIRVDGPRAWNENLSIRVDLTDLGRVYRLTLRNGVLSHTSSAAATEAEADVTLTLTMPALTALLAGQIPPEEFADAGIKLDGDAGVLGRLLAVLDEPDPDFAIVTP
jgi:alkyl sulfatase BDS1-like metallo-beta-lactamase superfamily hydrolase